MAATGYTPISLYYSNSPTAAPVYTNVVYGELAINITDGKLYYRDNNDAVQIIASKSTAGGNATALLNTGSVTTDSTFYIPFLGNNTTSYQSTNTNGYLSFNPNKALLTVGTVGALGGTTNPVVAITGASTNYIQSYIYNSTNGSASSADIVAYVSNSTDSHGWTDMGITSAAFADASYSVTGPNESYLFGSGPTGTSGTGNLVYATDSTGSANSHQWYIGGFGQAKSAWKMQLTTTGLQLANALSISYGGTGQTTASAAFNALSPVTSTGDLIVGNGSNSSTRLAIGANNYVLTSNGTTATWAASSGVSAGKSIALAMIFGF